MIGTGTVAWFDLDRKFGFAALNGGGDVFHEIASHVTGWQCRPQHRTEWR
jgi:cold shock CspA family protein